MADNTEDALLRELLLDAASAEFSEALSSAEPVAVSPRFQRQMGEMLADPQRWAKRRTRPLWKKCVQTAAAVFLVCSLSLGTLVAVSPAVRAAVLRWTTEWYETNVVYRYAGEQISGPLPQYEITALPEGYVEVERFTLPGYESVTYRNTEGLLLRLDYIFMHQGAAHSILTEDMETSEITVGGFSGQLFLSQIPEQSNAVTWIDPAANLQFTVDGFMDKSGLLHIAESISLVKTAN